MHREELPACRPTAQSAEALALQESRASAERELGMLQQRETQLARAVLAEEERLQGMQAEAAALGELTDDLEREQVGRLQYILAKSVGLQCSDAKMQYMLVKSVGLALQKCNTAGVVKPQCLPCCLLHQMSDPMCGPI